MRIDAQRADALVVSCACAKRAERENMLPPEMAITR